MTSDRLVTSEAGPDERLAELPRSPVAATAVPRMIGYRTAMPGVHRGLPSPWLTLVFPLSGELPIDVADAGILRSGRYVIPVGGLHTRPVYLPPPRDGGGAIAAQRGVQLDVHPLAARALFGVPAGELTGRVLELGDLLGRDAVRLTDDLGGGVDAGRATAVVARWLDQRLTGGGHGRPAGAVTVQQAPGVRRAWRLIVGSGGRCRIGDVAREVGWSRRHLTVRLRTETGLGAKDLARVARFQRARSLVSSSTHSLADIAASCGYADQSHLSTEWREFAGCTIGQWMAEELPWLSAPS